MTSGKQLLRDKREAILVEAFDVAALEPGVWRNACRLGPTRGRANAEGPNRKNSVLCHIHVDLSKGVNDWVEVEFVPSTLKRIAEAKCILPEKPLVQAEAETLIAEAQAFLSRKINSVRRPLSTAVNLLLALDMIPGNPQVQYNGWTRAWFARLSTSNTWCITPKALKEMDAFDKLQSKLGAPHGLILWEPTGGNPEPQPPTLDPPEEARPSALRSLLLRSQNLILEGVPGTGKTFAIQNEICRGWSAEARPLAGRGEGPFAITLHPATTYEDFVEGLRPVVSTGRVGFNGPGLTPRANGSAAVRSYARSGAGEIRSGDALAEDRFFHAPLPGIHQGRPDGGFAMQDGFFLTVCAEAVNHPDADFVVLLDEVNRCNVPKVLGDLLTTLERSKRATWTTAGPGPDHWDLKACQVVTLPGSKRRFFVPDNVFVVATMNTTDRSVAPLDAALRRRFAFHRCWPIGFADEQRTADDCFAAFVDSTGEQDGGPARSLLEREAEDAARSAFLQVVKHWANCNSALHRHGGPDALLGHSYLFDLAADLLAQDPDAEGYPAACASWRDHHWQHHLSPQLGHTIHANRLATKLREVQTIPRFLGSS